MIELRDVDKGNLWDIVKLKVADSQSEFVASNLVSMAQAKVYPTAIPQAVYAGGQPVGFVMYGPDDEDEDRWWLIRLMVDEKHQGRGYGRAALAAVIDRVKAAAPEQREMFLSVEPENAGAIALYHAAGFEFDERVIEGEHVMRLAW